MRLSHVIKIILTYLLTYLNNTNLTSWKLTIRAIVRRDSRLGGGKRPSFLLALPVFPPIQVVTLQSFSCSESAVQIVLEFLCSCIFWRSTVDTFQGPTPTQKFSVNRSWQESCRTANILHVKKLNHGPFSRCVILCYFCVLSLGCSCSVVNTSGSYWLERFVSEMIYLLMGTLNSTQWHRPVVKQMGRGQSGQAIKLFQAPREISFTFHFWYNSVVKL